MPGTVSDAPSVSLSFANNFWGRDDAGVSPLLERMHNAKVTGDELKSFYTSRAAIEDEYARKLLALARKPLGSSEGGTLRMSLDVVRGEVESVGRAHQNIATQMKTELEETLSAFTGGMKERRKIVQGGIEKLLKIKTQQTTTVNKARDRYEQDCLKIKGYLAQGHMVMGQEERKNKAKLEKTQIQLSTTSNEYEAAVKILEDTTGRWNRDWKAACDKFQDLEEERIDFMKSSLWSFANIASTVCVSDDASCEKIRLSLEDCDVEKDIMSFIKENGTGQEIPDPPKFINFCKGDINDAASEASDDGNYSVAQFQRTMNPAFRTSSPQPSMLDTSRYEPQEISDSITQQGLRESTPGSTPRKAVPVPSMTNSQSPGRPQQSFELAPRSEFPEVPHNEYPMDGMTQFCRIGPPSDRSSIASPVRPPSRDSQSEYSNPTSFSSQDPSLGPPSPVKSDFGGSNRHQDDETPKKRSGFFQNHSPFRRKSQKERENPVDKSTITPNSRNAWTSPSQRTTGSAGTSPVRQHRHFGQESVYGDRSSVGASASPEPVDPRANFQLNVGNNVFDVASPDARMRSRPNGTAAPDENDPIAKALADLKGVTKQASVRMSADRYHGLRTPAPDAAASRRSGDFANSSFSSSHGPTSPPMYDQPPVSRLGAPQPAFTSRQMQQTTQRYVDKTQNLFNASPRQGQGQKMQQSPPKNMPQARHGAGTSSNSRATSPAPHRSISPRPGSFHDGGRQQDMLRGNSPGPYPQMSVPNQRPHGQPSSPTKQRGDPYEGYNFAPRQPQGQSMSQNISRSASPQPNFSRSQGDRAHPTQSAGGAPGGYGNPQQRGRPMAAQNNGRPQSQFSNHPQQQSGGHAEQRVRSKSMADNGQFTKDGRPILHYSRAMYMYQAAIPEELSFTKGDILAVLRLQDDGWWEAEVVGKRARPGLVPSNYLVNC